MSDDIPIEVCYDILSRVPAEPLLRFRCVCKPWRSMIDDPDFIKLQFDRCNSDGNKMLTVANHTGKLYSIGLTSISCLKPKRTKDLELNCIDMAFSIPNLPVPLCRGLFLVSNRRVKEEEVWTLCNICTGDCVLELPPCKDIHMIGMHHNGKGIGLGFDPSSDDYKVVRVYAQCDLFRPDPYVIKAWIYSLKSRDWCRIEDLYGFQGLWDNIGVFANGALHWIVYSAISRCVIALHLTTQTYSTLPLPPECLCIDWNLMQFHEFNGCLCVTARNILLKLYAVWILQNDGGENQDVWVEVVSLTLPSGTELPDMRVLAYMKTAQQVVIQYKNYKLLWFDVEKQKCVKKVTNMSHGGPFSYQVLPASLMKRSSDDTLPLKLRIPNSSVPWYE